MFKISHIFLVCFCFQEWLAFLGNGSDLNLTMAGETFFANTGSPSADDNYGFCQVSDSCQSPC